MESFTGEAELHGDLGGQGLPDPDGAASPDVPWRSAASWAWCSASCRASAGSPERRCCCRSPSTWTRTRRSRCCSVSARPPRPAIPIPAVLFGVPGGAASAATVLDGFPMAKKGEAGRALSAAYMSSLMGGMFGAALLAISIPILRPVMLFLGSPELLAFSVLGISMVAIAVRQRAAARAHRRLPRHHDRDDRHRSADRHAALDLRQPLSVGRPAADAAAARRLRAAGAVRPADRAGRDLVEERDRPTSTRASGRA